MVAGTAAVSSLVSIAVSMDSELVIVESARLGQDVRLWAGLLLMLMLLLPTTFGLLLLLGT